ncbi:unnamed protein product [Soboliphyme baturini]|uniref:Transposase n=1 Tax=Soboliphyme baturini TaxID=241478 RepID=A0A183J222_9BILA|nr:unnamed protein product [Soboliphyme baturini]
MAATKPDSGTGLDPTARPTDRPTTTSFSDEERRKDCCCMGGGTRLQVELMFDAATRRAEQIVLQIVDAAFDDTNT